MADDSVEEIVTAGAAAAATSGSNSGSAAPAGRKRKGKAPSGAAAAATADSAVAAAPAAAAEPAAAAAAADEDRKKIDRLNEQLALLQMFQHIDNSAKRRPKEDMSQYKFWGTQPVPRTDEVVTDEGPIEPNKPISEIRAEPYPIHKDFEWVTVDLEDEAENRDVYELLSNNYVEDDEATLRFDYSAEFIKWALMPPGWRRDWHLGVRVKTSRKLVGFIGGIPARVSVRGKEISMVEINFLCVHKKLRSKRLAPMLIKEVTRRINLTGIFQAAYTAGVYLPKPVATCRYYHRSLNPKKLVDTGFSYIPRNMTMARMIRLYKVPEEPKTPGMRLMTAADVPQVTKLLRKYQSKFELYHMLNEEEVAHWLTPIDKVVYSYVVEDEKKRITDVVSFYSLPSAVIGKSAHSHINAAYLFHYAPSDLGAGDKRLQQIIYDALILAKAASFDVFNCIEFMDNAKFIEPLKFGRGNGDLHFYLYNYRCADVARENVALFMV
ncbi:glycylpeptide N-tetradecanoyltransferase [Polyrhizophydium stewartii]|uniref:Glycylpeptide N-tetradecanoyltransferase n=1 Tax=Polyrhizophydium stewartii TaxID=2732419 RepID=A0ABR4N549_9FUNG